MTLLETAHLIKRLCPKLTLCQYRLLLYLAAGLTLRQSAKRLGIKPANAVIYRNKARAKAQALYHHLKAQHQANQEP